ncbi:MAG: GatB/YqeY domain-containing protein [Gammaproteobacteria bacterium]|nr:MAG: GatB/YqeY domain-containing protein [Gammaproteobacteria bacterium]
MRERNKEKTSTLRMALSELKKEEIDRREEITNEDSIKILQRMIKQRKESKTQFLEAGRSELADKENEEILILQDFLPEQLSEEAIKIIVLEAISETQAKEPQDMGKVMGALKSKIKGNADMGIVSKIVKENL